MDGKKDIVVCRTSSRSFFSAVAERDTTVLLLRCFVVRALFFDCSNYYYYHFIMSGEEGEANPDALTVRIRDQVRREREKVVRTNDTVFG